MGNPVKCFDEHNDLVLVLVSVVYIPHFLQNYFIALISEIDKNCIDNFYARFQKNLQSL